MSELKVGDKVWVLCEVVDLYKNWASTHIDAKHDGTLFRAKQSDCRLDESPAIEASTKTANDQLLESLKDYPFGEPANSPKIPDSSSDPVNPSHYKQGGIECIDAIKAALGEGFPDYLRGNVMKYLWRYKEKGGIDDLRKSAWYLDRLIEEVGE